MLATACKSTQNVFAKVNREYTRPRHEFVYVHTVPILCGHMQMAAATTQWGGTSGSAEIAVEYKYDGIRLQVQCMYT